MVQSKGIRLRQKPPRSCGGVPQFACWLPVFWVAGRRLPPYEVAWTQHVRAPPVVDMSRQSEWGLSAVSCYLQALAAVSDWWVVGECGTGLTAFFHCSSCFCQAISHWGHFESPDTLPGATGIWPSLFKRYANCVMATPGGSN